MPPETTELDYVKAWLVTPRVIWCRHAAPRASEISARGTIILLAPTGHHNSLRYHRHTAAILLHTFVFPSPNFTLFSRTLHTLSRRRTSSFFPVSDSELKHVETGTQNIDHQGPVTFIAYALPNAHRWSPTWNRCFSTYGRTRWLIKTPSHIASCSTTETAV
jgi:hypothetical protein